MKEILKELTGLNAPSGHEHYIAQRIAEIFKDYCDEVKIDKLYNVTGVKKANSDKNRGFKIMLAAHMDEIGMMVSDIDKNGFIKFIPIGGIDPRILSSQEVVIHGRQKIYGIIGSKPPHLINEAEEKKQTAFEDLYIDAGMSEKQARDLIQTGDTITFKPHWQELQNGLAASKSLDNRAGVAAVIGLLKEVKDLKHDVDIICTATVQEEVGLRGAIVSSYGIMPDAAVAVDGGFGDMPGLDKDETFILGKGPAIAIGPNIHPALSEGLKQAAVENDIPYQLDVEPGSTGTDAWAIQVSRTGIPTALVSIPLRYMHTTVETVSIEDLKNTSKLLCNFIMDIGQRLEGMKCL